MGNKKYIEDILKSLKEKIKKQIEIKEFEKALEGLLVNVPSSIENIKSMIKPKE